MPLIVISKRLLIIVSVVIASMSAVFFLRTPMRQPAQAQVDLAPNTSSTATTIGIPIQIKIPSINVDAPIEQVGLTPSGAMGVPTTLSTTAWYAPGPRPGEIGSAVIDGHYGWENGVPAVFNNVHKLKIGHQIIIVDNAGSSTIFIVRRIRSYNPREIVPAVFTSSDNQAHLNLITCEGVWNTTMKIYPKRLVVFADVQ